MNNSKTIFNIPLIFGKSDLLRLSKDLNVALGLKDRRKGIARLPDGRDFPIIINPVHETIVGLGPWFAECDTSKYNSVEITVVENNEENILLSVRFSMTKLNSYSNNSTHQVQIPDEGLYLGQKLESEFLKIRPTHEPVTLNKSDLLKHIFICGKTGTGKTVLAKIILEEVALLQIPVIAIDLKGDISSLAIQATGENPRDLIPWIPIREEAEKEKKAAEISSEHREHLKEWGFDFTHSTDFNKKVRVQVFTPRSDVGFRLAISPFVEPNIDINELREEDQDSFEEFVDFMANSFVSRLTLNKQKSEKAVGYVYEIIKSFWQKGISLKGYVGIERILDEIKNDSNSIETIGEMLTNEYITTRDRDIIADSINRLTIGAQKRWFRGFPLDIQQLIDPSNFNGKTPIAIINLMHLNFQDQAYIIGHIAHLIWFWMRNLEGIDEPRLLFYIDEIAGGGGKEAFFPSVANTPSKKALNRILRQGRSYGVCCLFATQSPGDIDYMALGQCSTWAIGQLRTNRERKKIEEAASKADKDYDKISDFLPKLDTGQFIIQAPSIKWSILQERWLKRPLHMPLNASGISRLKEDYEKEVVNLLEEAKLLAISGEYVEAENVYKSIIDGYIFSSNINAAYQQLGKMYYEVSDYDSAIKWLTKLLGFCMESSEIGMASFIIGMCMEQQDNFNDAKDYFINVTNSEVSEDLKSSGRNHLDYCNSRIEWPELNMLDRFITWIRGEKPDKSILIKLEKRDKDIIKSEFASMLSGKDFLIPEPIDEKLLQEALRITEKEQAMKTEILERLIRDTEKRANMVEELIRSDSIDAAFLEINRILDIIIKNKIPCPYEIEEIIMKYGKRFEEKSEQASRKIRNLKAEQFEYEIANLFEKMGYNSNVTQYSRDGGVDVYCIKDGEKLIIQCKRWENIVGRSVVDELAGVKQRLGIDKAILITTSRFSQNAIRFAQDNRIELWDKYKLFREYKKILESTYTL